MTIITPKWNAPKQVRAFTSTRLTGQSDYPYHSLNLGFRTGDNDRHVIHNRDLLIQQNEIPSSPVWLHQTHSTIVLDLETSDDVIADACITRQPSQVLAILTADCLPIIITNNDGTEVAAIHAGWRGLCHGIIDKTLNKMQSNPDTCIAWIGPSICGHCFEVGDEVCQQFKDKYDFSEKYCFYKNKWHIHLDLLARQILRDLGVLNIEISKLCTFEQKNLFYSYRRDGQTGRIGTFIWFEQSKG